MKKLWLLLLLAMPSPVLAAPPGRVAMVLAIKGTVPTRIGAILVSGDSVTLGAGAEITVLLLDKGQRQQITGPAELVVGDGSITRKGGSSHSLETPKVVAALNARNFRRIGGATMRKAPTDALGFSDVTLSSDGQNVTVRLELPSKEPPPPLTIKLEAGFGGMDIDLATHRVGEHQEDPADTLSVWKDIPAKQMGSVWIYTATGSVTATGTLAVRARDQKGQVLFCRARILTGTERSNLENRRAQLEAWAAKAPQDTTPYLILSGLYDDVDQLGPAVHFIDLALKRLPGDPGLLACRARLELDLGHYTQALDDLERSNH